MMAKPIRALELHYPMIQFLIKPIINWKEICIVDSTIHLLNNCGVVFHKNATHRWSFEQLEYVNVMMLLNWCYKQIDHDSALSFSAPVSLLMSQL